MNVGIIGFGFMGQRRARSLAELDGHRLVAVCDPDAARARALENQMAYEIAGSWQDLAGRRDVDAVIVAVPHHLAHDAVLCAVNAGKHVLCEKPLGLSTTENQEMIEAAARAGVELAAGFNQMTEALERSRGH